MREYINIFIVTAMSFLMGYCGYVHGVEISNQITSEREAEIYEEGFITALDCRAMLSRPSCELLLEKTKDSNE